LACIRRTTLDAFWSRAQPRSRENTYLVRSLIRSAEQNFGLDDGAFEAPGPLPAEDHCRYRVAMQLVASSMGAGRYSGTHDNGIPSGCRSAYSNQFRSIARGNATTLA
jgi:hypothetical protein